MRKLSAYGWWVVALIALGVLTFVWAVTPLLPMWWANR